MHEGRMYQQKPFRTRSGIGKPTGRPIDLTPNLPPELVKTFDGEGNVIAVTWPGKGTVRVQSIFDDNGNLIGYHAIRSTIESIVDELVEGRSLTEGMDVYGRDPSSESGKYFRANIWSWPSILALIHQVNRRFSLNIDLREWDLNDGRGLDTQEECSELAAALEIHLAENPDTETFTAHSGGGLAVSVSDKIRDMDIGEVPEYDFSVERDHVERFIRFLKSCGGFEIQ